MRVASAYVWVIAGICRSCSVLVFVVWLFGVCVVVVMVVCACCQPRLFASFVIVCGYMISIFWMLCIPLCLRSLRAFSSAYVWVIAGICRSCSVLVFVVWLLGVCVVVV